MRDHANPPSISEMVGQTFTRVDGEAGGDVMSFLRADGSGFAFLHYNDCCERVGIEDICGDVADLVGSPLVLAEECSSNEPDSYAYGDDSHTWTFYRFATVKGTVTVRWLGESNGYYSESVDIERIKASE